MMSRFLAWASGSGGEASNGGESNDIGLGEPGEMLSSSLNTRVWDSGERP